MFSRLALGDLKKLEASGIRVSHKDAIRLNALGLRVERAANAADTVAAPRIAWAGGVAFHEPTVQASLWFDDFARKWWEGQSLFYARAWSCAHADVPGFFEPYGEELAARHAIAKWRTRLGVTDSQIVTALSYAVFGENEPEIASPSQKQTADGCPVTELIDRALAAGLGVSYERLTAFPFRRIVDILARHARNSRDALLGAPDEKAIRERLHDLAASDYFRELDRIERVYSRTETAK